MSAQSIDGGLRYQTECDCGHLVQRTFLGQKPVMTNENEVWVECRECNSIVLCTVAPADNQPGRSA